MSTDELMRGVRDNHQVQLRAHEAENEKLRMANVDLQTVLREREAELLETRDRLAYWVKRFEKSDRELETYEKKMNGLLGSVKAVLVAEDVRAAAACVAIAELLEDEF